MPRRVSLLKSTALSAMVLLCTGIPSTASAQLTGFVDLHAHPATHLAFGRKLIHGAPDVGSLIPADSACRGNVTASSIGHALGEDNGSHGPPLILDPRFMVNSCGDQIRSEVIDGLQAANGAVVTPELAGGYPNFKDWPKWNDITHQKMWIDWIKRAHEGNLRVMVALATNNKTLGDAVIGPGDGPTDDKASADLQIQAIKDLVSRHTDFMQIATTPAELRAIVTARKLAVVIGVELDAFGNFYKKNAAPTESQIAAEITRLRNAGVRYFFPVHTIDNHLSGTAVYQDAFNLSNYREAGSFWNLTCAPETDEVNFRFDANDPGTLDAAMMFIKSTKLGIDPLVEAPRPPSCTALAGQVNSLGLTPLGRFALRELMRQGMMIDIDHMSQRAVEEALIIAEGVPATSDLGFPLNSGHNGPRPPFERDALGRVIFGSDGRPKGGGPEHARTIQQIRRIFNLKGMFGLGLAGQSPSEFMSYYRKVATAAGPDAMTNGFIGMGTDMNGLVVGGRPAEISLWEPLSTTGNKTWDYTTDGMAHYGMLKEFRLFMEASDGSIRTGLDNSAERFAKMWERVEAQKSKVKTTPEMLVHQKQGSSVTHESDYMDYVAWDGARWCAKIYGKGFLHAPNCNWSQAHSDSYIAYRSWDNKNWQAAINGKTFTHTLNGQSHTDVILNYISGGANWTVRLK